MIRKQSNFGLLLKNIIGKKRGNSWIIAYYVIIWIGYKFDRLWLVLLPLNISFKVVLTIFCFFGVQHTYFLENMQIYIKDQEWNIVICLSNVSISFLCVSITKYWKRDRCRSCTILNPKFARHWGFQNKNGKS